MSEIYANLGNICGICVREPPQSRLWGTPRGTGELVGWRWVDGGIGRGMVRLGVAGLGGGGETGGGWWDWRGLVGLGMVGGRDLARKLRESVSGLSKLTRPSTLLVQIRARSKKKKRPPARKGSAWDGRC